MANKPGFFEDQDSHRTLGIEVEGKTFWVSRESLASFSPVFKAMLYGHLAESKKDTITLPGKKAADIEELLQCILPSPKTTKEVDDSNFEILLALADEYQIDSIPPKVEKFLHIKTLKAGRLDEELLRILRIGSKYKMKALLADCVKRCAFEFELDKLKTLFPELRGKVVASLMLYSVQPQTCPDPKDGCSYFRAKNASQSKCYFCEVDVTGKYVIKCSFCAIILCAMCFGRGVGSRACTGTMGNDDEVRALLERF